MKFFFRQTTMMKILNLFETYTLNNSLLTIDAIKYIINICLTENNLFNIVNDVMFVDINDNNSTLASYDRFSKTLYINTCELYKHNTFECNDGLYNYNIVYLINQKIIFTIFHELCHAISFNKIGKNNALINKIIDYSLEIQSYNFNLYLSNHDSFPYEREADVFAYEHLLWLLERMDYRIVDDNIKRRVYYNYMMRLLSDYGFNYWNNNPLQSIVNANNYVKIINEVNQYNLDLYERLTFGLPISLDERNQVIDYADNLILSRSKEKYLI